MALIRKINPVALDREIDFFQAYLWPKLGFDVVDGTTWESLHRIYLNAMDGRLIPEAYETDGEYSEVFYNDNFSVTSYFIVPERRTVTAEGITEADVSLVFTVDLKQLYPNITHRADEEFNNAVQFAAEKYSDYDSFKFSGLETTIDLVFREFIKDKIEFDDMSNQYVVRFNFKVLYTPEC